MQSIIKRNNFFNIQKQKKTTKFNNKIYTYISFVFNTINL